MLTLFDRDFLVDFIDVDTLPSAVSAKAEVDRGSQRIIEYHEEHGAGVRPADGIQREVKRWDVWVPEPFDQQPVQEEQENQAGEGDQGHLYAG